MVEWHRLRTELISRNVYIIGCYYPFAARHVPSNLLSWCQRFVALDTQNHVPKLTSRIVFWGIWKCDLQRHHGKRSKVVLVADISKGCWLKKSECFMLKLSCLPPVKCLADKWHAVSAPLQFVDSFPLMIPCHYTRTIGQLIQALLCYALRPAS